ncbi:MAG TPA: N-acetylmuramoyl-L-alanine amidase [Gemmatimonadaceae bacterium]|nr:N-acetylmuramoyl-L-alanine amidase [Gemmatimonadaceae bacterium]
MKMSNTSRRIPFTVMSLALLAGAACAPARVPAPAPTPAIVRPPAPINPNLPAMPLATGPLAINVVYPRQGETVGSTDSAFIFGSIGHGEAFLTINGTAAPVWPNGAFMAFLPVPPRENPTYELVATVGSETVRLIHPVQLPPEPPADTVVATVPPPDTVTGRWALVATPAATDPDRIVWGPAVPDPDTTRFLFLPGTAVRVTGQMGNRLHVAVDDSQVVNLPATDLVLQPAGVIPPVRRAGTLRVMPAAEWVEIVIPVGGPPPYLFSSDSSALQLILFGTTSSQAGDTTGESRSTPVTDSLITSVEHTHTATRSTYRFNLTRSVYAYAPVWREGEFVVRIRRPPQVDSASPLRGLTIAVDPGHPGLAGESPGATGPTGLREPDAVLVIGLQLRDMLTERGARVVMTRGTDQPVPLNARAAMAARENAHALVSVHLNAVPDHVNPFTAHGTSTYHWFPHSRRLAETTHEALLRNMHLPDLGVRRENFAVIRNPWMPSILPEGAFIIMPDQEYALRTPEYQAAYARAMLEGLEAYFRELAAGR